MNIFLRVLAIFGLFQPQSFDDIKMKTNMVGSGPGI